MARTLASQRDGYEAMWPGITRGFDARCTGCSWSWYRGVYQVKARDVMCLNHGGTLEDCLARMARAGRLISGAPAAGEAG